MHFVPSWGNPLGRMKRWGFVAGGVSLLSLRMGGLSFSFLSPLVLAGGDEFLAPALALCLLPLPSWILTPWQHEPRSKCLLSSVTLFTVPCHSNRNATKAGSICHKKLFRGKKA